jgi:Domain of unknown function (DUF4129)
MDEGRDSTRGGSSGARLAAVLAAVAAVVLLAIAAAGSGASPFGPGAAAGRASPPDSLVWGLLATLAVLAVGAAVAVIVLAIVWREQVELPTRSRWRASGILLLVGLVVLAMLLRSARGLPSWPPLGSPGAAPGGGAAVPGARPDSAGWLPLAVAAAGLLAWVGVAVLAARRGRRPAAEPSEAERLAQLVEEALLGLAAETDPRRAVIAAYDVMERGLAAAGLPRRPGETPLEHTTRTLLDAHVPAPPVTALAALFERARFSAHEIDQGMRGEALAALDEVRAALRERARAAAGTDADQREPLRSGPEGEPLRSGPEGKPLRSGPEGGPA